MRSCLSDQFGMHGTADQKVGVVAGWVGAGIGLGPILHFVSFFYSFQSRENARQDANRAHCLVVVQLRK